MSLKGKSSSLEKNQSYFQRITFIYNTKLMENSFLIPVYYSVNLNKNKWKTSSRCFENSKIMSRFRSPILLKQTKHLDC